MAVVLTISATGLRETRRLASGALTLGRAPDNDWALPDDGASPTLSRRHCRLVATANGFTVTDLGSANGTVLGGRPLPPHTPTPIRSGDQLELGPHRLLLTIDDAPAEASPGAPRMTDPLFTSDPLQDRPPASPARASPGAAVPGASDFDALFAGWGADAPAPLPPGRATPPAFEQDPLEGLFEPAFAPLDAAPGPLPDDRSSDPPPQFEALSPHGRSRPTESFTSGAGSAANDPFGLADWPPLPGTTAPPQPSQPRPQREEHAAPGTGPEAVSAGRPRPAEPEALLEAFLRGAGLSLRDVDVDDPAAFLEEAGRSFAGLSEGLRAMLAMRAAMKDHARLERTQIGAEHNNPLKFSINAREAAAALLRHRAAGYLAPRQAIEASFRDLRGHELGLLEGLQSAANELLASFDPGALEARLADAGRLQLLVQGGRRAALWELYTELYGEIARHARQRFMGHFDGAFRRAYQRKSGETAALDMPSLPEPRR